MAEQRQYTEEEAEQILRLAAQKTSGGITRDRLLQMAGELGMTPDQVARAEQEYLTKRDAEVERKAFESHVLRELWSHVAIYIAVNGGLLGMDYFADGRISWAMWPIIGWGIGLACHVAGVFFADAKSENDEFRKWKKERPVEPLTDEQRRALDDIALLEPIGKIHAIKELRERLSLDIREAKDAVDQYEQINPGVFRT